MSMLNSLTNNQKQDLSYLIGAFLGDGCCYIGKNSYQFSITGNDRDICETCSNICKDIFGKGGRVKDILKDDKYSYSQLVVCSKRIVELFSKYTEGKSRIPDLALSELNRKHFIQGIMDTDGWISRINPKDGYVRYRVAFKNTAGWVDQIKKAMKSLGVKTGTIRTIKNYRNFKHNKDAFEFSINSQDYCRKIGFRCKRKDQLAKECIGFYDDKQKDI